MFHCCIQASEIDPGRVDEVGDTIVNIVSGLKQEDEQSTDNLDLIANVFENVNELVQSGQVNISESVSCTTKL